MATDKENQEKKQQEEPALKPDEETLHTPDPQKEMEGPVSTLMHKTGHSFKSDKTKEEAEEERSKNM